MEFIREVSVLIEKEILLEKKQKTVIGLGMFFAFLLAFVFSIIFIDTTIDRRLFAGLLWIAITFTVILVVNRSIYVDQENNCIAAIFMSPVSKQAVFWGKSLAIFFMLTILQVFMVLMFMVFFQISLETSSMGKLFLVHLLGAHALSAITILVGLMVIRIKGGEILLPVILLPLLIPLLISLVEASNLVLIGSEEQLSQWLKIILFYNVGVIIVPSLFIENLTDE
ncbi:MAG: hypothetical protein APF76_00695 [Desulfitibacter sp. BRH_c19]|nr:MAG: hypothetical protein APF76_00695 [Desulfitibacter sp. BRH_c19]